MIGRSTIDRGKQQEHRAVANSRWCGGAGYLKRCWQGERDGSGVEEDEVQGFFLKKKFKYIILIQNVSRVLSVLSVD